MNKNRFNFYANNEFKNAKPSKSNESKSLVEYAKIEDYDKLIELGHKNMARANYFAAFWCFEIAVCRCPSSFEAHLGEYKAWFWYCISLLEDPFSSITSDLYNILLEYTPKEYLDEIQNMHENDNLLASNMLKDLGAL